MNDHFAVNCESSVHDSVACIPISDYFGFPGYQVGVFAIEGT